VGVNSAIYSKSGGSVGIGFAIPSNMVKFVVSSLTTDGKLVRPWFGGVGQTVSSDIAASIGLKRPVGILISKLYPNGPAARAGIRIGDVIISIDGKVVNDPGGLRFRLATRQIGKKSKLVVYRRGNRKVLNFPVEAPPRKPSPQITELSGVHPLQGATVANLSPALAEEIGADVMARGVVVLQVRRGGAANRFGFEPGDLVSVINGKEVKSVGKLQLDLKRDVSRWRIEINRGGKVLSMSVNR
jgi:S1-C subfamily serine protease